MAQQVDSDVFPPLPLEQWEDTKDTLHLFLQIVGKIRLGLFPKTNHWWHVPLYVSSRGCTTRAIPYGARNFAMSFDFIDHALKICTSDGEQKTVPLNGLSVADFYRSVFDYLKKLGIEVSIWAAPYDVPDISTEPFATDTLHATYDGSSAHTYWRILVAVNSVFQSFRGRFMGKCSPVHLFWHHFDLAVTRFTGREAPPRPGANIVEREAYSHEVISFGFWPGDKTVREPAFYAYGAPVPDGLADEPLEPEAAVYDSDAGTALLMYDAVRQTDAPRETILTFLESFYQAAARRMILDTGPLTLPDGGSTTPLK
ncbi:MAG: DUF5996 family protein [Deltaproteobacteria bacterium]